MWHNDLALFAEERGRTEELDYIVNVMGDVAITERFVPNKSRALL